MIKSDPMPTMSANMLLAVIVAVILIGLITSEKIWEAVEKWQDRNDKKPPSDFPD